MPETSLIESLLSGGVGRLHELKAKVATAEETLRSLKSDFNAIETQVIEQMEFNSLKTIKDSLGRSVTLVNPILRASVKKENPSAGLEWLEKNKYEYAVKKTIHSGTLSRILKERMDIGEPIPDGIFSVYFQKNLRLGK